MGKRGPKPKRREVVWSPELAYAIGLIATDGCLSGDGRHLIFVSKDIEQINNLKKCLGLKVKIGVHKSGRKNETRTYHRLQWGDVVLYDFLLTIGLTPKKSLTLGALSIPDEYFFDFLRGSCDGDGSFYSYYDPRWRSSYMFYLNFTSASAAHIKWLRDTLQRLIQVFGHIAKSKETAIRREISTLRYAKRETLLILREMYANQKEVHLFRKRLKIERALRIVGESLP
jgi:hypothetical protein